MEKCRVLWPWAAALLSGALMTLCFPRWNQSWLCWIALTPLISAVLIPARNPWWKNMTLGYCTGLVFFWWAFSWLTTVTGIGWFLLAFYLALYFAFWSWFLGMFRNVDCTRSPGNLRVALIAAAAWASHEWLRGILFTGFGWNGLGVALHRELAYIQIVDVTGVGGLSFVVVFCNVIAVQTARRLVAEFGKGRFRPRYDFILAVVMVTSMFAYGMRALLKRREPGLALKVAAVQANIPQNEKFNEAFEEKIFERYTRLSEAALATRPDLLVWPECATPRAMFGDERNLRFVLNVAQQGDFNFLLGTLDFDEAGDYNAAVLLTQRGEQQQIYRKLHLVPFGEFIPLRHSFPLFAWVAGDLVPGDFLPGQTRVLLTTEKPSARLAPLICFEDTLGDLTRRFVLDGAQLLVNLTNDGWFLHSDGAEQHLANSIFRSIENRRPLVRCANTGVTCFVDVCGRILQQIRSPKGDPFTEGLLIGMIDVPTNRNQTFYTKFGEVFSVGALLTTIGAMIGMLVGNTRRRQ